MNNIHDPNETSDLKKDVSEKDAVASSTPDPGSAAASSSMEHKDEAPAPASEAGAEDESHSGIYHGFGGEPDGIPLLNRILPEVLGAAGVFFLAYAAWKAYEWYRNQKKDD